MNLKAIITICAASAALIGCTSRQEPPKRVSQSQLAYYDTSGRLIYRGGPLYDSNGRQISPAAPAPYGRGPNRPPIPTPNINTPPVQTPQLQPIRNNTGQVFSSPQQPVLTRPQLQNLQPNIPEIPKIVQPVSVENIPVQQQPNIPAGNSRFDANGNLIQKSLDIPTPKFDANGNILVDANGTNYAEKLQPQQPIQTAAVQIPQALQPQQPNQTIQPTPISTPISGDPRATAGFDLGGSSWVVREIENRRIGSDMTLYFVPIGSQSLAIIDGPCGQQRGVYQNGRGGDIMISGISGCAKDSNLSAIFNRARRFTISKDQKNLQMIDESGAKIANLSAL